MPENIREKTVLTHYEQISPFITKDGSLIRELMHPSTHAVVSQSLAEAEVPVGMKTVLHRHQQSEEIYYVTQGKGMMQLAEEQFVVKEGDTVCITPGTPHCIENTGDEVLKILCACSPAYSHEDTELVG